MRAELRQPLLAATVSGLDHAVGVKPACIRPGSPWENGYCESFNARFGTDPLNVSPLIAYGRPKSGSNNGASLQYGRAAQRTAVPSPCPRKHRSNGPQPHDALTIKPDHPMAARQPTLTNEMFHPKALTERAIGGMTPAVKLKKAT